MAVDTEAKRWGMLQLSSGPSYYPLVFNPDTSGLVAIERATVLKLYGGIAFDAPAGAGGLSVNLAGSGGLAGRGGLAGKGGGFGSVRYVALESTFYFKFTTRDFDTGAPQTLGGTPVISAYEDANLTQITAGITLMEDYDSTTGLNHVEVVATAANGYEAGKYYAFTITTGTVDTVSVVGEVVHEIVVGPVDANVTQISSDGPAADNAEAFFDGTGYAGTNNVIPTVTTLTGHTAQTGDTYALANGATGFSAIDTVVDAVKAKTDSLTFTVANQVDANTLSVGGTTQTANDIGADANTLVTQIGTAGDGLTAINLPNQTMDIVGNITGNLSGSVGSVTAETTADVTKISGSATAADNLEASALGIVPGSFTTVTSKTVLIDTALPNVNSETYINRWLVITSGNADGEATKITDYDGGTTTLTVDSLATLPTAADTYVIV